MHAVECICTRLISTYAQVMLAAFYSSFTAPNIIKAAKGCGFSYLAGKGVGNEHEFLILDEKAINRAPVQSSVSSVPKFYVTL